MELKEQTVKKEREHSVFRSMRADSIFLEIVGGAKTINDINRRKVAKGVILSYSTLRGHLAKLKKKKVIITKKPSVEVEYYVDSDKIAEHFLELLEADELYAQISNERKNDVIRTVSKSDLWMIIKTFYETVMLPFLNKYEADYNYTMKIGIDTDLKHIIRILLFRSGAINDGATPNELFPKKKLVITGRPVRANPYVDELNIIASKFAAVRNEIENLIPREKYFIEPSDDDYRKFLEALQKKKD